MPVQFNDIPTWKDWQSASSSAFQIRSHKPRLVVIDNLIKKYPTLTGPGKRACLVDISKALYEWAADKISRNVDTGRLEAMRALEKIVQQKIQASKPNKYEEVSCLAYALPTGRWGNTGPNRKGIMYGGHQDNMIDISKRSSVLRTAIRSAYSMYTTTLIHGSQDAIDFLGGHRPAILEPVKRLKLFVAPEFFFRGIEGAYDVSAVPEVFRLMRMETGNPQYADWVFVIGTVICASMKHKKALVDQEKGMIMENFALIQRGGPPGQDLYDHYIEKEFVSHIDYDRPKDGQPGAYFGAKDRKVYLGSGGGTAHTALALPGSRDLKPADYLKKQGTNERGSGGSIFKMAGVTFGLEICLDHLKGRLKFAKDSAGVQVQLIPSAGAHIDEKNVVQGAVAFNVDGGGAGKSDVYDSRTGPPHFVEKTHVAGPATLGCFTSAGKIVLYPPVSIPA